MVGFDKINGNRTINPHLNNSISVLLVATFVPNEIHESVEGFRTNRKILSIMFFPS